MNVGVAEVAELLLQIALETVRVAVQIKGVHAQVASCDGGRERRAVRVFVEV